MIKPFHIFLYCLIVISAIFCLSLCIPNGKLKLGAMEIYVPDFSGKSAENTKPKDISRFVQLGKSLDSLSLINANDSLRDAASILNTDSLRGLIRPLEFPEGNDTLLNSFFSQLTELASGKHLIHILHYGDSQIEGDRITSYLRNQFQTKFGGEGIGLFPVIAVNNAVSAYQYQISDNWTGYNPHFPDQKPPHNNYGALINFSRLKADSKSKKENDMIEGWINLQNSNTNYFKAKQFSLCKVYYGFNNAPLEVELKQKDSVIDADIVPPCVTLNSLTWNFKHPEKNLTLKFKSNQPPDFFGISLTGNSGINVDNVPLRGSSGLEFTKTNKTFLGNFYKELNVKLIIMQFGVNVVPNITDNYDYYEKNFRRQLEFIKQADPEIQIIVIGVSDAAQNTANGLASFPNIEKIRNAQKSAAFSTGCAFWDLYEAMGGKNSMASWVNANPPLAQKDFVHFNAYGARIIGEMFYRSIINEYERFNAKYKKS